LEISLNRATLIGWFGLDKTLPHTQKKKINDGATQVVKRTCG
jgi:hypothetical protein